MKGAAKHPKMAHNRLVAGSSPAGPTTFSRLGTAERRVGHVDVDLACDNELMSLEIDAGTAIRPRGAGTGARPVLSATRMRASQR